MDKMYKRLDEIKERYEELTKLLIDPEVLSDNRLMSKYAKEQASISKSYDTYLELLKADQEIADAKLLLNEEDYDIREMAKIELESLEVKRQELIDQLENLLIERDPNDECNAIIEIRGAAGGDEGNIFAGDLFRMYTKYCDANNFKWELLETMESEAGGYALISFMVKGNNAYGTFKYESGSHRVQRVPKTESQGRIHTSTATVLVLPELEDIEININPNDLEIDTLRASGAGGQHVNKTDSAVRITHKPTGITVKCQDGRSQHDNRDKAMMLIKQKVYEYEKSKIDLEQGLERKNKVGSGDRSEKIRTYNYPQNRVSDHRINLTLQQLDRIIEGKLQDIFDALDKYYQAQKIAGNE